MGAGKGSRRVPMTVTKAEWDSNYERIWGKKRRKNTKKQQTP